MLEKRFTILEAEVENIERESVDGIKRIGSEIEGKIT